MARKVALKKTEAVAVDDAQPVPATEDFWADPRREQALKMFLNGTPKTAIATRIGVHRNTINNWCSDSRFVAELNQRMREHVSAKRVRRQMATNVINDVNERIVVALGTKIEKELKIDAETGVPSGVIDGKELRSYREMSYEFREMREQERHDIGDDIKRVSVNSQHTITGDVNVTHHGVNDTPFADYVKRAIDENTIDVDAIDVEDNNGQFLLKAAEHVLVDTDVLDRINEEDKATEEANRQ